MIQKTRVSFQIKILETIYDGFRGIIPKEKGLFKGINIIRDKVIFKEFNFEKNDLVEISLENVEKAREDIITENRIEFYIAVFQIASNGFYTKSFKEGEDPKSSKLFYDSRGMITGPALSKNPYELGDIIKVVIRR